MSKYDKIKDLSENEFKRLTGVEKQTFNKMLAILNEKETKKLGGRPNVLCVEDRLLMT